MNNETKPTPAINPDALDVFLVTYGGVRCIKMLGSYDAAQTLIDLVYVLAHEKLPELDRSRKHLTRDLCCDVWFAMSFRQRACAGMCMAFLAREGLLPIVLHQTKSGKGARKYWIAPDRVAVSMTSATEAP